jgi:mxaK protein
MVLLVLLSVLLVMDLYQLLRQRDINEQVHLLSQQDYIEASSVNLEEVDVLLAYAAMLNRFQLYDQAMESYSKAERLADDKQLPYIFYNMGNIHLRQAIEFGQNTDVDKAIAMADVAKEYFRFALQRDPQFWDAKYNYEVAQRLSRDLPLGDLIEREQSEDGSAELWSAMPGFPIGLP